MAIPDRIYGAISDISADQYFDVSWDKSLDAELWAIEEIDRRRFQIGFLVGGDGWRILRSGATVRMYVQDRALRTLAMLKFC